MYKDLIYRMELMLNNMRDSKAYYELRLDEISDYLQQNLKTWKSKTGIRYYAASHNINEKADYLGNSSNEEVKKIKEARFLNESIKILEKNIKVLERTVHQLRPIDYDYINSQLPKVYRNASIKKLISNEARTLAWKEQALAYKARFPVYKPEELKIGTNSGEKVRSKSEALIYNMLFDRGVAFVYELPLKVGAKTLIPDFTLLSEKDHMTEIIIEHQGLMDSECYRNRFAEKLHTYWNAGYTQGINIFYTFDSNKGGLDTMPIAEIIENRIKRDS